jgi:light-regulated signal transduction histidine kinase (bacteriophytochrome)
VIEKTLFNLGASIQESGVAIEMGPMPHVEGDENQLIELLQNLLVNAIKFRAQDAPRIRLTAEVKEGFWTFAVKDNGIGIDPAYKDRIFVIFQRLHTRAEYAGTGIGLAVCKRIVERHGGHIWVESTLGEGATFCFTLRAVNAGADEAWAYIDGLAI